MDYAIAMKRTLSFVTFTLLALFSDSVKAEEPFETQYINGQHVFIKNPMWHAKEGGKWLFTCRLEASAERLVKPIAHLHLYHIVKTDDSEEIVWEQKAIVRRNKFDKSYGSRKATFVRVAVKDLPEDIESVTVEFKNKPPTAKD